MSITVAPSSFRDDVSQGLILVPFASLSLLGFNFNSHASANNPQICVLFYDYSRGHYLYSLIS